MLPTLLLPALILAAPGTDEGTFAFTKARLAAIAAGDVDRILALYDPWAEAVGTDGRLAKGPEALRARWTGLLAKGPLRVELKEVNYVAGPDGVFVHALIALTTPGEPPVLEHVTEYRVKKQGRWLLRYESFQRAEG
ncbi:MAG TPA: nuclear transport factor 2 family protein [Holophagaceae bacterium]|nr:nuclear transport factor 2 family protein [Holophagaceae bacterium]